MCSYRGEKEIQAGDAISIVRGDESCRVRAHLDAAPKGVSNVILDANGRAFFDFTAVTPSVGYQLCVCPGTAMVYEDGGVRACPDDVAFRQDESFTVQSTLQGINLKGLSGGTLVCCFKNLIVDCMPLPAFCCSCLFS